MPALSYPTEAELISWGIKWDYGASDLSTLVSSVGVDQNTASRKLLCKWENRFDVAKYVIGQSRVWDDGGTLKLSRLLPVRFPGRSWLIATKADNMKPHGRNSWTAGSGNATWDGVATWPQCSMDILYERAPYKLAEDDDTASELLRYVEYPAGNPEPSAEALNLPGSSFKYTADPAGNLAGSSLVGTPIPFGISKVVPQEKFYVTWHRLPYEDVWNPASPLYERIYGTSEGDEVPFWGAVNSAEFQGRPIGTVILSNVIPMKKAGIEDDWEVDLKMEFTFKPSGWNWVYGYRPITGNTAGNSPNGWYLATTDGNYATANSIVDFRSIHCGRDLNKLFDVDSV